ncbi:MAG: CHAT domain-containing protein [Fischerella sp.]|uniref:CHAT domain-containing protein n=1 Tax=Fischerella sp. TaxID=1191 RepID=UPI0017EF4889|nr:CHAT domain-containing protein [Fischerella sp.]NWF60089.1 CHAT domain-containing protein [Fischerella sp.]
MNEQRQQAYLNLIQSLLNCPDGEEPEILAANQDLLDADFLDVLVAVAEMMAQEGNENTANWLINLATILARYLYEPFLFLIEVLQATAESRGDAQVVYSLLAANTDKLNLLFADVLRRWATTTLEEMQPDEAEYLAAVLVLFSNRIREFPLGDKASNMEIAIAGYEIALTVYTRQALPQDWAMTQNNLGTAYSNRIQGDRAENLESAIAAYTAALEVRTRQALPQEWATTQNNLGTAYRNRIQGDRAENLESAIAAYTAALEVFTRQALPQNHAETLFNLGLLYQQEKRYTLAYNTFESAIETVESLRGEIVSGEESKRKQAEEWNALYRRMVEVCLALQEDTQAVEYIERSKTRNLVELLFTHDCYPKGEIPPEVKNQLQQLRQEIEEEKRRLEQAEQTQSFDINRSKLNQLRQQREQLMSRIIGFNPIRYSEIQNLLDEETAIIEWYIFNDCFRAFIITHDKDKPEIWPSNAEDLEKLVNWTFDEYLELYYDDKLKWRYCLHNQLTQLAEILHLDEIVSLLAGAKKIILVPHRYLHLLPIHALQLASGEYLIDKFPNGVSYAPSCQLLHFAKSKATPPSPQAGRGSNLFCNFFAIQNPTDDLEFTDIEVETIADTFHPHHILKKSAATEAALAEQPNADNFHDAHWLHFSCHGYFNFNFPLQSGLQLADTLISPIPTDAEATRLLKISDDVAIDLEKCLTLEDIFNLSFPNCRLVTLSACESGLVDFTNTSDECIGLPSGFIKAGTANVVSSLWAVDDFSTACAIGE